MSAQAAQDCTGHVQRGFFTHFDATLSLHGHLREVILLPQWFSSKRQEEDPARLLNASAKTGTMSLPSDLLDKAVTGPTQAQGMGDRLCLLTGEQQAPRTSTSRRWETVL